LLARARSATGAFVDRARELGIDLRVAEVLRWGDYDGDGRDDLCWLDDGAVHVERNAGARFEHVDGGSLGLALPPAGKVDTFNDASIRLADFDRDGELDVLVPDYGPRASHFLFLRDGERFEDVTSDVGFGDVRGENVVVLADLDNDGDE
jgi:hypothetical protein